MATLPIKNALISVSDKLGLADFARALVAAQVELYSTGGTRRFLEEQNIPVRDISAYTGFPEMMDGRVKTLHPKVHGGILCRRDHAEDMQSITEHGMVPFDLVVVNLYPFEATIRRPGVSVDEAIEQIDIGGPSLIRAAAKNHAFVAVATAPDQYASIVEQLQELQGTSFELRRRLAGQAFARTADYDRAIADYFAKLNGPAESFPQTLNLSLRRKAVLRYGENPHQQAAVYSNPAVDGNDLVSGRQLHGKELSYNNLLDLDSALAIVRTLPDRAAVVIKHNNPCGAASAGRLAEAMRAALDGDPVSAFGSVIGVNCPLDAATAEVLVEPDRFVEAIVAPSFEPAAVELLTTRPKWKANVRLMQVGELDPQQVHLQLRYLEGGYLAQESDVLPSLESEWRVVTSAQPTDEQLQELRFAWALVRHVKSNAIVLTRGRALVGAGAGQMSRVDSVEIAIRKAGDRGRGAVLASDAFFPFPDSIQHAAAAGVTAVIQPGGSRRDDEVIAACNEYHLPMIFTGRRHFKH